MKEKIKLPILDKIRLHLFPLLPISGKEIVRNYLNQCAEERADKMETKHLIESSNAISKAR